MPSQAIPAFLAHVAYNVRTRRLAAGLSQKALAEASGVSLRMIGAIENGSTSVSTSTLDRIGIALGASLADLVREEGAHAASLTVNRLGWSSERGGQGTLVSSIPARKEAETWEWLLEPGDSYNAGADPAGWHVQLIVVEGTLTLEIGGERMKLSHQSHAFASDIRHSFVNRTRSRVRFFRITVC